MSPPLLPRTAVLWRAADVVQLESGPHRVVIENVSSADVAWLLSGQDGSVDRAGTLMSVKGSVEGSVARASADGAAFGGEREPAQSGRTRAAYRSVGSLAELRTVLVELGIADCSPMPVPAEPSRHQDPDSGPTGPASADAPPRHTAPQDAALQDAALQDAALQDAALQDAALQDAALQDAAPSRSPAGIRRPAVDRCPAYRTADLFAWEMRGRERAEQILDLRSCSAVTVHGKTRVAATLATTLAAAGVGCVTVVDDGEVSAALACPGGLLPADEGRRFSDAAAASMVRAAPGVSTGPSWPAASADLVILTDPRPVSETLRTSLHLQRLPHLRVWVDGQHAEIGPLVRPGVTSCLRCADLHRLDRDPAWSLLAVQLMQPPRRGPASDSALCVATAGVAASQALAFLDDDEAATEGATLEWQLPDWRLRRRSWPIHAECGCAAANTGSDAAE